MSQPEATPQWFLSYVVKVEARLTRLETYFKIFGTIATIMLSITTSITVLELFKQLKP